RVMTAEQSNTSLVFDERIIVKLFRRPVEGDNPEVEMTAALVAQGFGAVAAPMGTQRGAGYHLAIAQPFLSGGVDGWALALTSLRDLFGVHDTAQMPIINFDSPPPPSDPGQAGGDFSAEARRLGETTAAMHVALAESLGRHPGDPAGWSDDVAKRLGSVEHPDLDLSPAAEIVEALRRADVGPSLRVHGDFHLGQVMRTDAGWYVLDFEGEPARTVDERRRPSSPLRDVAGMLRSFHYAAAVACGERDDAAWELGMAWEARNRKAFLDGYLPIAAGAGILPGDDQSISAVLVALELEKAAYELAYERAYRPEWEAIPLAALRRLTRG
ncbi:MAG: phosphotransferase, partial [Pseudonocardiaceae bacterium]